MSTFAALIFMQFKYCCCLTTKNVHFVNVIVSTTTEPAVRFGPSIEYMCFAIGIRLLFLLNILGILKELATWRNSRISLTWPGARSKKHSRHCLLVYFPRANKIFVQMHFAMAIMDCFVLLHHHNFLTKPTVYKKWFAFFVGVNNSEKTWSNAFGHCVFNNFECINMNEHSMVWHNNYAISPVRRAMKYVWTFEKLQRGPNHSLCQIYSANEQSRSQMGTLCMARW